MNYLKITVKTPKNQAAKCEKTQRKQLLTIKKANNIITSKVTKHNEFYWIITYKDNKELEKIQQRLALGEIGIKKFYKYLFKIINKANKLAQKFKKGTEWIKRWLIKKIKKTTKDNPELINQIQEMTKDDINGFITITDKEEMTKLLSQDLITTEHIKNPQQASKPPPSQKHSKAKQQD